MQGNHAQIISNWQYENEYAIYNFHPNKDTINELMNGDYYVFLDKNNILSGYFCFGKSARIPAIEKDAYELEILDFGLGLKPCLCGKGLGVSFVRSGLDFAEKNFHIRQLRLTVARFNTRAISVYKKNKFQMNKSVTHLITKMEFFIMYYLY